MKPGPQAFLVLVAFGAGAALAAVPSAPYVAGQPLLAESLQGDFQEIEARLASLEQAVSYSGQAVWVATTPSTYTGVFSDGGAVGYAAAKSICEAQVGTSTAHMCTSEELVRTSQVGVAGAGDGWFSAGVMFAENSGATQRSDCAGWKENAAANIFGPVWKWDSGQGRPDFAVCSSQLPILCCD